MSIFQAFTIGTLGLQAQSRAIGIVADNLANVNTVGYKKLSPNFKTLLGNDVASSAYTPGGVLGRGRQVTSLQGLITNTSSATDIAVSGNGFFAVRSIDPLQNGILFTRAGSFIPNANGDFINGGGFMLQGWELDENGALPAGAGAGTLTTVNVRNLTIDPIPTTLVSLFANLSASQAPLANSSIAVSANLDAAQLALPTANVSIAGNLNAAQTAHAGAYDPTLGTESMAGGGVTPHYLRAITVIDNTGAVRTLNFGFLKTAADTWDVEVYVRPAADINEGAGFLPGQLAFGSVSFNADGTLASISPNLTAPITASWTNGGAVDIDFALGTVGADDGLSQTAAAFASDLTASPDYDPNVTATSMTSGAIVPHYLATVAATDNLGNARTLNVGFVKTGANQWAVEIYGQPLTDVTSGGAVAGQVASGSITFHDNGSINSISPSLLGALPVGWNASPLENSVTFDWESQGAATGLTQNADVFSSTLTATQNYDPDTPAINMASGNVPTHLNIPFSVIDSDGNEHTLIAGFLKTGTNTWAVEIYAQPATDIAGGDNQVASGLVTFNGDGSLASVDPALATATIGWANGLTSQIDFNMGTAGEMAGTPGATTIGLTDGLAQLTAAYRQRYTQNGYAAGELESVEISEEGIIIGLYSNGATRSLYQIPLVTFASDSQLENLSGNVYAVTNGSGQPNYLQAAQGGAGKIIGGALENSNVDLADQLTMMILAQRAYQSNTKTISVSDEMLQDLTRMVE